VKNFDMGIKPPGLRKTREVGKNGPTWQVFRNLPGLLYFFEAHIQLRFRKNSLNGQPEFIACRRGQSPEPVFRKRAAGEPVILKRRAHLP